MSKKEKLILAIMQVDNLKSLCRSFDYQDYCLSKLIKLRHELQRQLSLDNAKNS